MDYGLTICLHMLLSRICVTGESVNLSILLVAAAVIMFGFLRSLDYSLASYFSTRRTRNILRAVSRRVQISELTGNEGVSGFVNVIPDEDHIAAFTLGLSNPEIYLTTALTDNFSPDEIEVVIRHELSHRDHRDPGRIAIFESLRHLFWFIPYFQKLPEMVQIGSELKADRNALISGHGETCVARILLNVACDPHALDLVPRASCSVLDQLEIRIRSLLGENQERLLRMKLSTVLTSVFLVMVILFSGMGVAAERIDPGGYVTMIKNAQDTCSESHSSDDIISLLGIECPHCGTESGNPHLTDSGPCH